MKRLESLDDNFLDKMIDAGAYTKAKDRYNAALQKLQVELTTKNSSLSKFQTLARAGIHLLENLPSFYQRSGVQTKRNIVSSIFPEKLTISQIKSRTLKINEAVRLITATDKGFTKNKTGQPFENLELFGGVEPTGVEPVSKHDIQTLSTCLFPDCLSEDDRAETNQSSS